MDLGRTELRSPGLWIVHISVVRAGVIESQVLPVELDGPVGVVSNGLGHLGPALGSAEPRVRTWKEQRQLGESYQLGRHGERLRFQDGDNTSQNDPHC